MSQNESGSAIIASAEKVILRDWLAEDVDRFVYWQTHGEWRAYDAPWERYRETLTVEQEEKTRKRFLERCVEPPSTPRTRAIVAAKDGTPIGWVNRYSQDRFPESWLVGIDICADEFLNRGIGTEALDVWVNYLFTNSTIHRIGLDTWSFNKRTMHVAEKLGFVLEGVERELIQWQGRWLDRIHFGLLRKEWEKKLRK